MGGVMTMKKCGQPEYSDKLILVFSMVSVMPLLVMSFVLYHISANSLESAIGGNCIYFQFTNSF